MKLSTKGRYGTRLMLELALHYGSGPIPLKDIAECQNISEKYLGNLIPSLKASGLIKSTQGAHGGYYLAKPPQDITLGEVVESVEGEMTLVECVNTPKTCNRSSSCVVREVWKEMQEKMMRCLNSITLKDMVDKRTQQTLVYNI